jgi:tetratricopeptide (TPR) repeat protein
VKLHGSADEPETIELTLARVGKPLEEWKRAALHRAADLPFVFVGYSDRDKDITPFLNTLENEWLWLLHDGSPIPKHLALGDSLDRMLARANRTVVLCRPPDVLSSLSSERFSDAPSKPTATWLGTLDGLVQRLAPNQRALILGDLLHDLLGDSEDARVAYEVARRTSPTADTQIQAFLKLACIPAEQWRNREAESLLAQIEQRIQLAEITPATEVSFYRLRAAVFQQRSVESNGAMSLAYAQRAVEENRRVEQIYRELERPVDEAWAKHNRAVTLHTSGKHDDALSLLENALAVFREHGELEHLAKGVNSYGSVLQACGDTQGALAAFREARDTFVGLGNDHWVARISTNIVEQLMDEGLESEAALLLGEAIEILDGFGDQHWVARARLLEAKLRPHGAP